MNKTKIEWCDSTWNPVTGCLHDCEYCYARGIARRFAGFEPRCGGEEIPEGKGTLPKSVYNSTHGEALHVFNEQPKKRIQTGQWKKAPYPYGFEPTLHRYRLNEYEKKKGRTIFVCSMADLFGSWVPDNWIEEVFATCEKSPQHRYLFLTKNPQRYIDFAKAGTLPAKDNMWYGTSVTNTKQMEQTADAFGELPSKIKTFFSIEPILEDISASSGWNYANNGRYANWIILGAETGSRKEKLVPEQEWIKKITTDCDEGGIPLFMKDSLVSVVGEGNMRREFPREFRR